MATGQQQNVFNAKRFAALLAGFDTGNPVEEEALSKGRALRRMASANGLRVVDAMEIPDVKKAIDDQMQPNRQESLELQYALEELAVHRRLLGQKIAEGETLMAMLKQEQEWRNAQPKENPVTMGNSICSIEPCLGAQSLVIELYACGIAFLLMMLAVFG